jgi:hypothetical protein
MSVKPTKLMRRRAAKCQSQKCFVWIEDGKLREKLFGFASGFRKAEERPIAQQRTHDGRDKLDDCLMRKPNRIFL